ncbi:nickel ABC transporter permease [Desmospora profundinema]|uniref:Nickel import system permease protein NikB n=1 Tax=Desmospora profundinema TaxID=1571184 RepID=A0ABU1ILP3_9BACL|nr:nickel ABC transporter permease [Desmospora profundinema]MDR6225702.1 peptide/nickel transport system permease protein [Desmospora profundinema]
MLRIVKRRLVQLVGVLLFLSVFTFALMKLAPGDPVLAILQADKITVTEADEAKLRQELGFDQPLLIQYSQWLLGLFRLDFGQSYLSGEPVWDEMMSRLPVTLQLTGGGLAVMMLISVPLGVVAACYPGRWPDQLSRLLALIGASIPSFWFGLLLIYFFAYKLQLLPSMGMGTFAQMILPSFALGFSLAAVYARLLRAGLLESLSQEYIRAARARGVRKWRILWRHAFRAALLPVVTVFGMSIGYLLGGSVVIEVLFSWPGLGSLAVEAIFGRDYPVIQGYVLLSGVFVVVMNLLVDLSYSLIDPRIRLGQEASQ